MIFEKLNNLLCYLWGEGDWKLRDLHRQIIDKLMTQLEARVSDKIKSQLGHKYFIQFIPEGRINTFFFDKLPNDLLIFDPDFQDALFKVELLVDGRKHYAQVTFVKGRIFSVEFKKPHKFFKSKDIKIGSVSRRKPKETFTAVIDRAAHTRNTNENP